MRKHYNATVKADAIKELLKEEKTISRLVAELGSGALSLIIVKGQFDEN